MNKVIISEEAFVMMIAGAAEVYDKETYGLLLGRRKKTDYYVQYAVAHQSSRRYTYGVQVTKKHEKKLFQTINFLKGYRYIGEFHSHPDAYCVLSKQDQKDMFAEGLGISLIVAIEKADGYRKWEYDNKDKCLKGTIDDTYFVEIKAYKCDDKGKKRIYKLRLECPFIKKLNKTVKRKYPVLLERKAKTTGRRKK
ncbi:Mov34/MPN/PAD-1 family protein [Candidatus Woesearchaeota archaeon]|nr:Mov34/MPN/PAD-1 family protein [Candidatus Woesearchaeota archaeon]